MKEEEIIGWFKKTIKAKNPALISGIGDDAAVVSTTKNGYLLMTTDVIIDGIHFRKEKTPLWKIGRKALAVNLSDIAAMGGIPLFALVSLGLPEGSVKLVSGIYKGMLNIAKKYGVEIIGGNLAKSPVLFVDVFLSGRVEKNMLKLRSGAGPGDRIFVTGTLGGTLDGKHLDFEPRIKEARKIASMQGVTSMMDISDGLSTDLTRLAGASGTGFILDLETIPVSTAAARISGTKKEAVFHALNDGEDYELLFTVSEKFAGRIPGKSGETRVTRIGTMTSEKRYKAVWRNRIVDISAKGFDHFKKVTSNKI